MYIIADGYWTQQLGGHIWLLDTTVQWSQMAIGHKSSVVTDGYWTQQLGGHRWLLDTTVQWSQMDIGHNSL